ncbi:NAD(P)-dependent oxidoreductase [Nocardioides nanhaiensis]|uniref:NAD(P)-dependent oxidoreductase n=1 Tax=Nocardioides nanhaiensis TaxID=1476871 RepID=A0ABP8W7F3_9ACTN
MTSTEAPAPQARAPLDGLVVGLVGLGAMGSPMARHLLAAGADVLGHDLDAGAVRRHVERGGRASGAVSELAGCDVVVTSLPSAAALMATLAELGPVAQQRSSVLPVIETSTLSLEEKTSAQRTAATSRIHLVDCPVSGTSAQAELGDLVAFCSGLEDAVRGPVESVLAAVARATHDVGTFGNGTRMKLVANLLVAVHNVAAAEALLLAERSGLDLEQVIDAVGDGAGSSRMLQVRGPLMARRTYEPATARVAIFEKDLRAIHGQAAQVDSPTPLLDVAASLYDTAARQGRRDQDAACVFAVLDESTSGPG